MRRTLALLLAGTLVFSAMCSGCAKKPEQKPSPAPSKMERAESDTNKITSEPTISLYINETKEKKKIKLEEYLAGVVAAEMDPTWPANALAAQAILARTFTLENIKTGRVKKLHGTDASTSVEEFQAYNPQKINANVRKAVQMTKGEVVLHKGKYPHAWFYACCGGRTATAVEGLAFEKEATPYVKSVPDSCLAITVPENKAWKAAFPMDQVRNAIKEQTGSDPGDINSVSIVKRGPSGRAEKLKIGNATVGGAALRLALGSDKLRSMMLTNVSVQGGQLVFQGKGFGHGVGLCQWGANNQARKGKKPQEIVRYYFKDVQIVRRWK